MQFDNAQPWEYKAWATYVYPDVDFDAYDPLAIARALRAAGKPVSDPLMAGFDRTKLAGIVARQQLADAVGAALQKKMDSVAKAWRYDGVLSARSYCGWDNPFRAEAEKLSNWCAACWLKAGEIEQGLMMGAMLPTLADVLAQMPAAPTR